MSAPTRPELWLRGPLPGIDPMLLPAAHTLVQAREDIAATVLGLIVAHGLRAPSAA